MQSALHILAELYGAQHLRDGAYIQAALIRAAEDAGATVLTHHFHHFSGGGVTGVLLLAESHISIHTWPEHDYAALDVFMCGNTQPRRAAEQISAALKATRCDIREIPRLSAPPLSQTIAPSLPDSSAAKHGSG